MATIARLLSSSYSSAFTFFHNDSYSISSQTFSRPLNSKTRASSLKLQPNDQGFWLVKDRDNLDFAKTETGEKILEIHCTSEYDKGLQLSQEKLVIAHFSARHYKYNLIIQRFMEERCRISSDVNFLHVMANDTEKIRQLCRRENIEKIPYFVFYKKMENIHEEEGFQPKKLVSNILYYGHDAFSPVVQLQSGEDLEKLIKVHKIDHKLIVVNVGMRRCIPCVKIYPSVLKLASQMADRVVFARMNADENNSCMKMLREIGVSRVPAFLFLKNGELCGRYIGSCASTLIREIMKLRADQTITALQRKHSNLTHSAISFDE
ncbi:thioredoxin-like protein CDSP32, chloroplastic [Sesamum indicum]|uniref:Thioredoxin-like protein CDSP32, chloroplastic n=1 Tax=Sesamum indicum TaxID=4182 RepID=A0A6I9TV27_SESIN|nr:thioredoxin-like protein CDSP32, chloroplastic [Sesamum indicum]